MWIARGVSLLSRLGLVSIWHAPGSELVFITVPWWKPQRGQSSIEYGLSIGVLGCLVWALWSMLQLTVTEVVHLVLDVIAPGSSWLVLGSF
jgi:hypothetical protein